MDVNEVVFFFLQITRTLFEEYPKLQQVHGGWLFQKATGEIDAAFTQIYSNLLGL